MKSPLTMRLIDCHSRTCHSRESGNPQKQKPILILALLIALQLTGCATPSKKPTGPVFNSNVQFKDADFRETWYATLSTIKSFPIKTIDKNSGLIETGWIDYSSGVYSETFGGDEIPQEGRFSLRIHVVEKFNAPKTRVSITKYEQLEGFLPDTYMDVASSGIMESVLQYRIDRAIEMNRRLQSKGLTPLPIRTPQIEGVSP